MLFNCICKILFLLKKKFNAYGLGLGTNPASFMFAKNSSVLLNLDSFERLYVFSYLKREIKLYFILKFCKAIEQNLL